MKIDNWLCKGINYFICIALLFVACQSHASKNQRKQVRIKAAFIFQMAKFVNWDLDTAEPLNFCFHQDNRNFHVYGALRDLQSKGKLIIANRQIELHILSDKYKNQQQYQKCSLVYFNPRTETKTPTAILQQLGKHKLIIGNSKAFLAKGGLTALIIEDGKNKLYINAKQFNRSDVKISSRLMSLARMYTD